MPAMVLPDRKLYTDYSHYRANFRWPADKGRPEPIIYHCFWTGVLTKHHELSLKSLLMTQSAPYDIWLWMPPKDISNNRDFIDSTDLAPCVKIRSYIPEDEARGTIYEGHIELLKRGKPSDIADGFRILILGKYGGVYFDLDVLFLSDIRPLCNVEFFYQWSNQMYGNNAVLHFIKNSPNVWALAERSIKVGSCYPSVLLRFSEISESLSSVYIFPAFLFDPIWISNDLGEPVNNYCNTFDDFFVRDTPITMQTFFPGSYAYHWHNRWARPIQKEAIIGRLYEEIQTSFKTNFPAQTRVQDDLISMAVDGPPLDRERYGSTDIVSFRADNQSEMIYSRLNRVVRVVPRDLAQLLQTCKGFKPLEEHVQTFNRSHYQKPHFETLASELGEVLPPSLVKVWQGLLKKTPRRRAEQAQDLESLTQQLRELADAGFLISEAELLKLNSRPIETHAADRGISTVGIVTCNKAESLRRCLVTYLQNSQRFERSPEFVVMDDSSSVNQRTETRAMLSSLKDQYHLNISYGGLEEKLIFAEEIIRCGDLPPEVVNFALFDVEQCGCSIGANRNALLLETTGDLLLSVDDDTLCQVGTASQVTNRMAFESRLDPRETWFFPTRADALSSVVNVQKDVLAIHEDLLGKSTGTLFSRNREAPPQFSNIDSRFLRSLQSNESRVLATMMGIVGDSGIAHPNRLLWLEGQARDQLLKSSSSYASGRTSRETLRAVRSPTVSNSSFCMTTVIGLDNRRVLPPFMPVQRSQDGLFGICLRKCYEYDYFGYLPWVIAHDPPDKRSYASDDIWAHTGRRMCNLIGQLIMSIDITNNGTQNQISKLGNSLVDLASQDLPDFAEMIRLQYCQQISQRLEMLDRMLDTYCSLPAYWAVDVRRYMDALRRAVQDENGFIPTDILNGRTASEALILTQRLVLKFGQLLYWWPSLVEVAKVRRAGKQRLAASV